VIQQIGYLQGDTVLQVKGLDFSASELLGGAAAAAPFRDGAFATIYLAPWNYHRVHAPLAGQVHRMLHVPGELWSVNATTAARVPRLFSRNERLVCQCLGAAGPFAVVLVGALNVGSMSTAWAGEVLPPAGAPGFAIDYAADAAPTRLARGGELGQFNMGSTVIILLPAGAVRWAEALAAGTPVRVGQSLGRLANPASS
jgi:phosphatidylserine decarboxylase